MEAASARSGYQVSLGGKDSEPVVPDRRVEKVFYQLQSKVKLPDDTQFATFVQEPNSREDTRLAVFLVMTPHPRKNLRAVQRPNIVTVTAIPLSRFKELEAQHRHYAGLTDPIRPIFAGVLRRHLKHYEQIKQNIEEAIN